MTDERALHDAVRRVQAREWVDRLEAIWRQFGKCIVARHFPPPGTPTQPIEAGYMANVWMRVRHPDYDELRHILNTIGETIRVRAN